MGSFNLTRINFVSRKLEKLSLNRSLENCLMINKEVMLFENGNNKKKDKY